MNRVQVLAKFFRNQCGGVAIPFGLMFVPLSFVIGVSVDVARQVDAKESLTVAMDSAVIAGTQYLLEHKGQVGQATKVAQDYFNAMIPAGKYSELDIKFKLNKKKNGLAAYGKATIPASLSSLAGYDTLSIQSETIDEASIAEATAPETSLELSLMLDVTSSMCDDGEGPCGSGSKISALKQAASDLIDDVVWDDQTAATSRVALVPFSTRVRVGPDGGGAAIMKKLTNLDATWTGTYKTCVTSTGAGGAETGGNWACSKYLKEAKINWKVMPCVTDRHFTSSWSFDTTDTAPGSGHWLNAHDGTRMVLGPDSSNTVATSEKGTPSDPATQWNFNQYGECADVDESNEIVPLTNDKAKLKSHISNLTAYGSTSGALGTAFAWYTLSPKWASIWTGAAEPASYNLVKERGPAGEVKLRKIAILMTDGSYNTLRGWKDSDIKLVSEGAATLCENMKAEGIEIYTVGFELDSLPVSELKYAQDTLQNCASAPEKFYDSANPKALKEAFDSIGTQLAGSMVRIVK
jgi:Flp pilus assembly protein TadG